MSDPFNQIRQQFEKMEKARLDRDNDIVNSINSIIRQQSLSGQLSILQQQKEILAHVYDKASAYSNLIMMGGYAAIFAIWQLMKSHLNFWQESLIAFLVTSSIILFTGFEIYKMISHAVFFRRLDKILSSSVPESQHVQAWQIAWKQRQAKESTIWIYFLIPTLLTGVGAGFVALWIFFRTI